MRLLSASRAAVAECTPMAQRPADAFVAFGITGNLAKEMTFKSLYRLESRGLLDCPIIGVAADDWTVALQQVFRRGQSAPEPAPAA